MRSLYSRNTSRTVLLQNKISRVRCVFVTTDICTHRFLQKVLYLRELRIAQMENMMAEFLFGVNVYLGVFRDSDIDHSIQTVVIFIIIINES